MGESRPLGVIIFGLILIVSSLDLLRHLPTYDLYRQINHEWPENVIKVRFVGSYIFRLLGLACGVGVLCLSDVFRKILVVFSCYAIVTLPLRHTYQAQLFFSEPLYYQKVTTMSLETFVWLAVIVRWFIDVFFSLMIILYFRNPSVIAHFATQRKTAAR